MPEEKSASPDRIPAPRLSRRTACKLGIATALLAAGRKVAGAVLPLTAHSSAPATKNQMTSKPHIAVIGAGAFGGWTALYLLRGGAQVTLLDAWGPGNSRASSGGETRVIRGAYGPDQPYSKLAARALVLWKQHEAQWKRKFFFPIGVLWMVEDDGTFERGSLPFLKDAGIPFEQLDVKELARRWPQINFEKVEWGIHEPQSGYLLARPSTQAVVDQFVAEGGEYRQATVAAQDLESGQWKALPLSDASTSNGSSIVGRPLRLRLWSMAGKALPANGRSAFHLDQARGIFLRHSCGRSALQRRQHTSLGRSQRPLHVRNSRQPGTRFQNCRRHARPRVRSNLRPTAGERRWSGRRAPLSRLPFSGDERCAAARNASLPIRKYNRPQFHHRSASRAIRMCGSSEEVQATDSSMAQRSARWWQSSC